MKQDTKNIIALLLNVLLLPGLGTIIHGEGKRGLRQIGTLIVGFVIASLAAVLLMWVGSGSELLVAFLVGIYLLIVFLVWIWALLDGIAFVQNREFYVFKNLK